eukprot:1622161-Ditylum_brightwellii.AAC.1
MLSLVSISAICSVDVITMSLFSKKLLLGVVKGVLLLKGAKSNNYVVLSVSLGFGSCHLQYPTMLGWISITGWG